MSCHGEVPSTRTAAGCDARGGEGVRGGGVPHLYQATVKNSRHMRRAKTPQ
jgi:hypothetical protein